MVSDSLPTLESVLSDYEIPFCDFAVVILHGVTHQPPDEVRSMARSMVDALVDSDLRAVVIYPNNDAGSAAILEEYRRLTDRGRFRVFPSVRFEAFLTLLHHSRMLIGNSSAGIREAPIYGVPSVNIGDRQRDRHHHPTITSCGTSAAEIHAAIEAARVAGRAEPDLHFGRGDSAARFADLLRSGSVWSLGSDKIFRDLPATDT
jgi:UDP-N-acetylglucosamine 2-epimerase (hydrolysing)